MATETPNPTLEQYLALRPKVTGRASIALREIRRRLELNLPGLIDETNTREGLTGEQVIRKPKFISHAPTGEENGNINGILMSGSRRFEFLGNGQMKNIYQISLYSIDQRCETAEQYERHHDRTDLIAATLFPFLSGCVDDKGRVCWQQLKPVDSGVEVQDWEIYHGQYLFYEMITDPSQNIWS